MWLFLSLLGPVLWAVSTHIDKYLVDRYFRDSDTAVLVIFTALIGVVMLPPIAWFAPDVFHQRAFDAALMAFSGVLYLAAMLFYLRAIQAEEASVVAPLFQTSTLFTYLFGYLFLRETLDAVQIAGGVLVIAGTLLVSFDLSAPRGRLKLALVLRMLACAGALALSSVLFKVFAIRDQFWITTFWTNIGEALFGIGIVAIPAYRRQFAHLFRRNPRAVLAINGANELINLGGGLGVRYAMLLAPVALVSAVSSTTTLFVFALGVVLTRFFPKFGREDLSRRNLIQKALASLLMAAGLVLFNITDSGT